MTPHRLRACRTGAAGTEGLRGEYAPPAGRTAKKQTKKTLQTYFYSSGAHFFEDVLATLMHLDRNRLLKVPYI